MDDQSYTLITGGLGFIASHFINRYAREFPQEQLVCVDKQSYVSRREYIDSELFDTGRVQLSCIELENYEKVAQLWEERRFEKVFHFAAESHVDASFKNSFAFTTSNVFGTHVLLECAHQHMKNGRPLKLFLHVSTDEVYGGDTDGATEHTTVLAPTNPYAASKMAAEAYCMAYQKSFGIPLVITRCNNVYGPHQYPEKLIPKFILALLRGEPLTVHGGGQSRRSFIWIDDVIDAYICISREYSAKKPEKLEIYNIGQTPYQDWSVLEIIERLRPLVKDHLIGTTTPSSIVYVQDRPFNDHRYSMSCSRLAGLGWGTTGLLPLDVGLKKTVEWMVAHGNTLFPNKPKEESKEESKENQTFVLLC
jgi:dTDP-glucose 4,6-dehydratase